MIYKCNKCGNNTYFQEINIIKTFIKQTNDGILENDVLDQFEGREDVICMECSANIESGYISEFKNGTISGL